MIQADDARSYATIYHAPVLCHTVLEFLITDHAGVYVDATGGGGGHTCALLDSLHPEGKVIAIDRDMDAIAAIRKRFAAALESGRLILLHGAFRALPSLVASYVPITGLLLDLGVSSHQLDHAARGFSHRMEAPLDMRMDSHTSCTAHKIINSYTEDALCSILYRWGEEPRARRIAKKIVTARPLKTTTGLAAVIRDSVPARFEAKTLARTFQALRIAVNGELDELAEVLKVSSEVVTTGGHFVAISYHSLEDRLVKRMLRHGNLDGVPTRDVYGRSLSPWKPLTRKAIVPNAREIAANPRARSARLRAAVRQIPPACAN